MTITITETTDSLLDGRVIAYDDNEQGEVQITGTYSGGTPTHVEYQVFRRDTSAVVQVNGNDWNTGTSESITGGDYSINAPNIPKTNSWLGLRVRWSDDHEDDAESANDIGVGFVLAITGQSFPAFWFIDGSGTPNDLTRMYLHSSTPKWNTITGNAAQTMANIFQAALSCPVGLLNYSQAASALIYENRIAPYYNYWLDDSNPRVLANAGAIFETGMATVEPLSRRCANHLCYVQGYTDASRGESKEDYSANSLRLYGLLATTAGYENIPIHLGGLAHHETLPDAGSQAVREAQMERVDVSATDNIYIGSTVIDLTAKQDTVHFTETNQVIEATRIAQSVLFAELNSGNYTYARGPSARGWKIVSSTETMVWIKLNDVATVITPTSAIDSFQVYTGSWISATGALDGYDDLKYARILLTHASGTVSDVRCLYGATPDVAYIIKDNTTLQLPLEISGSITEGCPVWYIADGKAQSSSNTSSYIEQDIILRSGNALSFNYEVLRYVSGDLYVDNFCTKTALNNAVGVHTADIEITDNSKTFRIVSEQWDGDLDNLSSN